jgi:hypothetical protein
METSSHRNNSPSPDQAEYQWVRVQAEVIEPISIGLGLFKIAPGGTNTFEQKRVNGSHVS